MVEVNLLTVKQAKGKAIILGVNQDRVAPSLAILGLDKNQKVVETLANKEIPIPFKTTVTLSADPLVVLVGLGKVEQLTQEKLGTIQNIANKAVQAAGHSSAVTSLALDVPGDSTLRALTEGSILGALKFDQYKSKKDEDAGTKKTFNLGILHSGKGTSAETIVSHSKLFAEATNHSRLLANTPANIATPEYLAEDAKKLGKKHGFKVTVKGRAQLRREGFDALCGVAQGSENEEQLVVMDYHPKGAKTTIVVVGKGVCFDSGGISLKPGAGMWDMKYDKCGACNTISLMSVLGRLGVKHRVIGITPCVENMPSGTAQRPGDIVTAKNGTTIEVLNTDAEGRLILADAVHFGTSFNPLWMCDMATLTGACDVAVGGTYVAALSKDQTLVESFVTASRKAGDKAWQLPQGEEYDEANKGTYADLQNISLTNKAGTAIGGSFVAHFAGSTPFVHLDIASKAWTTGMDYFAKGPTGAGTRIVLQKILDT